MPEAFRLETVEGEEIRRLRAAREELAPWKKWGPYVSERQWGTVREDYSASGDPWTAFPHDHARSRAYRWGEDGLAALSDDQQQLCFALALWNGNDPILKERLFGLANGEGNHGEDVKEYYFYLDSTPTHSYMKWLYKYPQRAYPYTTLLETNRQRSRDEREYELIDTGIFDDDRYFDVFVEYAKAAPEDILVRITAINRAAVAAPLHLLPTLWFRNTWQGRQDVAKPVLHDVSGGYRAIEAFHDQLGVRWLYLQGAPELLFTENETNNVRLFGTSNPSVHVKDGINECVVHGCRDAVNPNGTGSKAAGHFQMTLGPGETAVVHLRLSSIEPEQITDPFRRFDEIFALRLFEADEFYRSITPVSASADAADVMRQALAGLLWNKQYYSFDAKKWLTDHGVDPFDVRHHHVRDQSWGHLVSADVISMPDKWEYPWFAAWSLPFHAVALAPVDFDFAVSQIELLLGATYLHPNGQIPACEWNFSQVSAPVHAWAAISLHRLARVLHRRSDPGFLGRVFGKLLVHYTWWLNRTDRFGKNVLEGGCLGLDNFGVFDRAATLPGGRAVEQSDALPWMALFCQNMLEIGIEASVHDPFDDFVGMFVDHFLEIAATTARIGHLGMWDEEDGFYYDVLRSADGQASRLKVRSISGLLPLCATTIVEAHEWRQMRRLDTRFRDGIARHPGLLDTVQPFDEDHRGCNGRGLLALVNRERLRRILTRMLDEREFLSPFGIRTLSRTHATYPGVVDIDGTEHRIRYCAAESDTAMFAGNVNWRGPVWMPMNVLLIRALLQFYRFYGDGFTVECPTGSGRTMTLFEVAREIADRLVSIFLRNPEGRRPVFGGAERFQSDAHWRDSLLFYECFHGDNGAGVGASHHTGATGLVAILIQMFWTLTPADVLEGRTRPFDDRVGETEFSLADSVRSAVSADGPL